MDVTCPACATRYVTDAQKLRGKSARMRCKACDTVWLVSGATEPKRAAVVKRGGERDHRDLFASRPVDLGSVKQTLRAPPPAESQIGGVAARNEASVLFTVDALQGNARVNTPVSESPPSRRLVVEDDEGIIDLNALASTPAKVGSRSIAPLFVSEPPPGAFAADVDGTGSQIPLRGRLSTRAMAGFAAAAVALVVGCVGLSAAFKGEEPVARTAALLAVTPPVTAAAPPVVLPPAPVAEPSPVGSSSGDDDAKASTSSKKTRAGGHGRGGGTKVQSGGGAALPKAPKAPKAVDKCGCKGDFNCILRCTATGK